MAARQFIPRLPPLRNVTTSLIRPRVPSTTTTTAPTAVVFATRPALMLRRATFATNNHRGDGRSRTIRIPPLPLAFIGLALGCLGVGLYEYLSSDIQKYPPPVRQALRKALYYQSKSESALALKYFGEALDLALKDQDLVRQHPDHLTGIIIQLGAYLESLGRLPEARQTLVLALRHLCRLEDHQPDDAILQQSHLDTLPPSSQRKIAGVAQKLADVLARMKRDEEAEKYYVWSVEHLLRLSSKPTSAYGDEGDKVVFDKEHMPAWLTQTEVGAALEALGGFYAARNKYGYAIPLYLKALDLAGVKTCHAAVLMNNLSDAYAALGRHDEAKHWAQRGLDLAQNPNTRKLLKDGDVCDETCGVLLYNMGMLFEQTNDKVKAAQFYEQARDHGNNLKLVEVVQQAHRGLKRVKD